MDVYNLQSALSVGLVFSFSPYISYQMTMATIFSTASFTLWQKLTRALPLGPILPNMIPGFKEKKNRVEVN